MCPNEPWPAERLPPSTSETCWRRSFHSAVASCFSGRIVYSIVPENICNRLTFAGMHLVVEPSEEKLPQVEETDVDISARELGKLVKEAECTTVAVYLRTSFAMRSLESGSLVL
jgi:hypothetical protein